MNGGGVAHKRIKAVEHFATVSIQLIKRTSTGQHLHRALTDPLQINAAGKIKDCHKRLINPVYFATLLNQTHRLNAHVFQPAKRINQRLILHIERRQRAVDARRDIIQLKALFDLLEIHRQLIRQMDIAVHNTGHKLNRMVRFQPCGLITDHRVGRRVGFVETVVGKFIQKVPNLYGLLFVDTVFL